LKGNITLKDKVNSTLSKKRTFFYTYGVFYIPNRTKIWLLSNKVRNYEWIRKYIKLRKRDAKITEQHVVERHKNKTKIIPIRKQDITDQILRCVKNDVEK
jgi:hypothetical protein